MKIRTYLLVFGVALLVPALVFAALALLGFARQERSVIEQRTVATTRALVSAIDRELSRSMSALQVLATARSLASDDLATFYEDARRVAAGRPEWLTIVLASAAGDRVMDLSLPFGSPLPPLSELASFEATLRSGQPTVGPVAAGRVVRRLGVPVRVPVERDGRVVYVLTAVLEVGGFTELLRRQQIPADWIGAVFDANRTLVARTRGQEQFIGRPVSPGLAGLLDSAPEGWGHGTTLDGLSVYTAFSRSPSTGWGVAIGIPAATVDGPLHHSLWILAGGGLALIVASVAASSLVGRRIAGPIASLADGARAFGRHDGVPAESRTVGPEEVVAVARALQEAEVERRRIENERAEMATVERARTEAEAASRAKDEFLAMLGHELRSPLNVLANAIAILNKLGTSQEPAARPREIIARQIAHLSGLVEDLLDVARVASGKIRLVRRPYDLGEIVRRGLAALADTGVLDRHTLHQHVATAWVEADEIRIEQIFTNLVSNAVKFTPPGGKIDVIVQRDGDHAVLRVADTGAGIDPDVLPRIFDPFVQDERSIHRSPGGLGLGLALVRRLTELHHGTVQVASEGSGRGASFTIRLPSIAAPQASPSVREARWGTES